MSSGLVYKPLLAHIITLHLAANWKNQIGQGIAMKTSSGKHALMVEFLEQNQNDFHRSNSYFSVFLGRMGVMELLY